MDEQLERKAESLVQTIRVMEKKTGAYAWNIFQGRFRALVGAADFQALCREREHRLLKSGLPDYPWKTEVDIGGVTFVALLERGPE